MGGYLSEDTTTLSNVSLTGRLSGSTLLGIYSGNSILPASGAVTLGQNRLLSIRTLAASSVTLSAANTNVRVDELVLTIGGPSGASLCIHSGGTTYIFNSALSAAIV